MRARRNAAAAAAALAFAALPGAALGEGERERFTGIARGRDGEVLYREAHEVLRAGDRLLSAATVYTDPAGRRIATLRTDFADDATVPAGGAHGAR